MVTALIGASGLIVGALYWPPPMPLQNTLSTSQKLARLDWIGYFLLASSLTLICMGLSWAESPYPWNDAHVVATIVVGGVLLIGLIAHQTFFQKHGLLDHDLFKKDRNFAIAIACFAMDGMIFWAYTAYFPFQMSTNYHYNTPELEGVRNCMVSQSVNCRVTCINMIRSEFLLHLCCGRLYSDHLILFQVHSRADSRLIPRIHRVLCSHG